MWSTERARNEAALDRLSKLAAALKKFGVTADLVPDRRPFPGLAVRIPAGTATPVDGPLPNDVIRIPAGAVMILAGRAHYWRQRSNGDLQLVGPLEDPITAAGTIVDRLRRGKRPAFIGPKAGRRRGRSSLLPDLRQMPP